MIFKKNCLYYSRMSFLGHLSLTHLEFYTRTKKFTEDQTKQSNTEMWMLKEILQAISSHPSLTLLYNSTPSNSKWPGCCQFQREICLLQVTSQENTATFRHFAKLWFPPTPLASCNSRNSFTLGKLREQIISTGGALRLPMTYKVIQRVICFLQDQKFQKVQ